MTEFAHVLANDGYRSGPMDYEQAVSYGYLLSELGNTNVKVEVTRIEQIQSEEDASGWNSFRQPVGSAVLHVSKKRKSKRKRGVARATARV